MLNIGKKKKKFFQYPVFNILYSIFNILIFSGCSFGPIAGNREIPRQSPQYRPDGPVREIDGLYFKVISNSESAERISQIADQIYQGILRDVKLTESSRPYSLTPLFLYGTAREYLETTKMPQWSGAVFMNNAIFAFTAPNLPETLAHEISHLIFQEFFAGSHDDLLWLNEGLAMYEESRAKADKGEENYKSAIPLLKGNYLKLIELTSTKTAMNHKEREAGIFYIESWLLVKFLIEQGGRVGFYEFLKSLRAGANLDAAVAAGYPGKWGGLAELETSFKAEYAVVW
ncbi:MAG: hypothetical protein HY747_05810 [Elusimicrobia bacterium]|nr:hypothetical protein [Elusimicrobiota bacterium]